MTLRPQQGLKGLVSYNPPLKAIKVLQGDVINILALV
jgi:hypothetical protein